MLPWEGVNMSTVDQRRVGRPSRPVLDRRRIGAAALQLVDDTGGFTLPELARRLGVQTPSLYHLSLIHI